MKNCLIVLGMHYSGTSAVTGALKILGVELGAQVDETRPACPKGLFENKHVSQTNDQILQTLGAAWDDVLPLPNNWQNTFQHSDLSADACDFLRSSVQADQLFAFKDTRLSRLLPFWLPLLDQEAITPHCVLVIRDPLELARSLAEREGFSLEKSLVLWTQHMLSAEAATRDLPRAFTHYDSLLNDPLGTLKHLFINTGLEAPEFLPEHSEALSDFLERDTQPHSAAGDQSDAQYSQAGTELYRLLCKIAEQEHPLPEDIDSIDKLGRQFNAYQNLFYGPGLVQSHTAQDAHNTPGDPDDGLPEGDNEGSQSATIASMEADCKEAWSTVSDLDTQLRQVKESLPFRAYLKYQEIVDTILPEGTQRLRTAQKYKQLLLGEDNAQQPVAETMEDEVSLDDEVENPLPRSESLLVQTITSSRDSEASWKALVFPTADNPTTSIIIPVFNNWHFTYACLKSICDFTEGSYEIIVVDNNSMDSTPELLDSMQGIRVITNDTNEVFVNACNQAAASAKGRYLLFLNNDTEVTPGWLDALIEPFSDPQTGIVGAKLVYPNGKLQEAGGIVWSDGSGCNYGHGQNPDSPEYCYRKAVDYCSGACLMITQNLWQTLGGFDQRYAPAYYEDTDLCFAARQHNYKVIYQPKAHVIHYGGGSAGKKTTSGYKRFQDINREKFVEKWQTVLASDHYSGGEDIDRARERTGDKQILVIDHYAPKFDQDSGSVRMIGILQILQQMGYKVFFWPEIPTYDPKYMGKLQDMGVEVFYGKRRFKKFLKQHGPNLDAAILSRPHTTQKYVHLVKRYSNARTIYDTVDLHFLREERQADLELRQAELDRKQAQKRVDKYKELEFFLANETDATLVVSPIEQQILSDEEFGHKVSVVTNIHSLEPCAKSFKDRQGLMFIGGFAHPPNEEGILWFVEKVLPLIRKKLRNVHLTIVGSNPTDRLKAIENDDITVTGFVEDVSDYFHDSRVFVSPLLYGAGVKGKIGQSFSFGLPVVTTSIGAEGMHLTDGVSALIADNAADFADKVVKLYKDRSLWQKLSTNSRKVIEEQFSHATIKTALEEVLAKPRPVVLHCHMFKNAGTTLDWSLQRNFGSAFMDHRDDDSMRKGATYLGKYIDDHPELSAISSHLVKFPLPISKRFDIHPIIALRHPIDRIGSVYKFERRQEGETKGAIMAKKLSFQDYVRWRMKPDTPHTIRNFHTHYCADFFGKKVRRKQYREALQRITELPQLIIVERYDESMVLLEMALAPIFPDIDLSYIRQNTSSERRDSLDERVATIHEDLGEELMAEVNKKNSWDLKLYEAGQTIFAERVDTVENMDELLEDFQLRCQRLTAPETAEHSH